MDISGYISDLLFEHDCVIIPGFGGFICNYQPAQIDRKLLTISPPSKAVSFNINLQSNDGLLINHIAATNQVTFDKAWDIVTTWVNSSNSLLKNNEEIILRNIGKIFPDIEGSLQFVPDSSVNYLKSSFGLKTVSAIPIYREKEISLPERAKRNTSTSNSNIWKMAAAIFLLFGLATLIKLMWMGVEIKPLNLDEAGVFNFISHIVPSPQPELKPIPIEVPATPVTNMAANDSANSNKPLVTVAEPATPNTLQTANNKLQTSNSIQPYAHGYFIIIGAFVEDKNVEAAKNRLLQKFPASVLFIEKSHRLTRIGYAAGADLDEANAALKIAQSQDSGAWILRK